MRKTNYKNKARQNSSKFLNSIAAKNALANATLMAQIQIIQANEGSVTGEFMRSQIGGNLAPNMEVRISGKEIQMFRIGKKNRGIKSELRKQRREKRKSK